MRNELFCYRRNIRPYFSLNNNFVIHYMWRRFTIKSKFNEKTIWLSFNTLSVYQHFTTFSYYCKTSPQTLPYLWIHLWLTSLVILISDKELIWAVQFLKSKNGKLALVVFNSVINFSILWHAFRWRVERHVLRVDSSFRRIPLFLIVDFTFLCFVVAITLFIKSWASCIFFTSKLIKVNKKCIYIYKKAKLLAASMAWKVSVLTHSDLKIDIYWKTAFRFTQRNNEMNMSIKVLRYIILFISML